MGPVQLGSDTRALTILNDRYGANFAGWLFAALSNTHLSQFLKLGPMLMLGAAFQVAAHALRAWKPPFALYVITFWLSSLGQAYQDTHGNTFVAGTKNSHRSLAFIHAMYMAGCLCGPFVATAIASAGAGPSKWYLFYAFPLALGLANMGLVLYAFWDSFTFRREKVSPATSEHDSSGPEVSRNQGALSLMRSTLTNRSVWLLSIFFFFFLGAALTAGGWVVEYLVVVRHGDLSQMGYIPAGFNGGSLLGRLLLAEPTHRLGERKMIFIYTILSIGLQLLFWL